MPLNLNDIAPKKGERALIIGGTRSGKSTLMDWFMRHIVETRPNVQILLLDSKPRFQAEVERFGPQNRFGRESQYYYKDWETGPVIPGSVRVDIHREKPLERFWRQDDKCRIAVAQTELATERARLLEIADGWYQVRSKKADRVLAIDELLDYYHRNSLSISPRHDVPLKVVRAGGERGFGALFGAQRPKRFATANHRRTFDTVPFPPSFCRRHKISVGNGNAEGNNPSRRTRRRLCIPRNSYPPWWKMCIRSYLSTHSIRCLPIPAI
jgi:energy-coupling factor transporter ATP-binding protein EcfA2